MDPAAVRYLALRVALRAVSGGGLPEEVRDELQRSLAALRDDVPPVRFADLERLMRQEFGGPLKDVFGDFDERAFAAGSIGQVHRARTVDGDDVAVKIQYPGVAEAVETDLRNATLLLPLVKRIAPGLDAKAFRAVLRIRRARCGRAPRAAWWSTTTTTHAAWPAQYAAKHGTRRWRGERAWVAQDREGGLAYPR